MINLKDIIIGFDKKLFSIDDISFDKGQVNVLTGKNGIGKSAFLLTLAGLNSTVKGVISLNEKGLASYSSKQLSSHIAYVNSSPKGVPFLSVDSYLLLGRSNYTNMFGKASETDLLEVEKAKTLFGIHHLSEKYTNELSSGELQLCAIAKAYVQQTDYILLDEPTSHLDYANKRKVYELLGRMANEHNKGIIISTHDLDLAFKFSFDFYLVDSHRKILRSIKSIKEVEQDFEE
ncbi:MAG: ABC transporter ATP-binding protein [Bacteroidota bacterium]|nr:ABC transporter ATP-binding protein [Bacteroidota bacterium]